MTATTGQAVYDAAQELIRASDGLRQAVQAGKATRALYERVHTAETAWIKARGGRLEAGRAAA